MARVQLRLTIEPDKTVAEVYVQIKRIDGGYETVVAAIDTGAAVSVFPMRILNSLVYRVVNEKVILQQAGIARQTFEAKEVIISLYLEDTTGARTREIEIKAWFAPTLKSLLGFEDFLNQAVLHIDLLHTRSGYIELADS